MYPTDGGKLLPLVYSRLVAFRLEHHPHEGAPGAGL